MVTHEQDIAREVSTRVIELLDGRILESGAAEEVS